MLTHIIAIIFFLISSTNADPPPNDQCTNAYQINITTPVITGDTYTSTTTHFDWNTFTSTFNTTVNVTVCNTESNSFNMNFFIYQGNCTKTESIIANAVFKSCRTFVQLPVLAGKQYFYILTFTDDGNVLKFSSYNITQSSLAAPTSAPTTAPSNYPTKTPSKAPSVTPSTSPTETPTTIPTTVPSMTPTTTPTMTPSNGPIKTPTKTPTTIVTDAPVLTPVNTPTLTEDTTCGLFGFNFFCPRRGQCGFWERLFGLGDC